jgi:hypothetical protein
MSAAQFADIKELKARVAALEEKLVGQQQPVLTPEQTQSLKVQRETLRLSLKRVQP